MANKVDSMSDEELRIKLAEHGFPVMPITASTRKMLMKKLKLVLDNKSKPRRSVDNKVDNRRSLACYSSGEESDGLDTTTNAKEKGGRRQTTGGAILPPAANKTRRPLISKKDSPVERDSDKGSESVTTRRVTRTYAANNQDDYETGSNSDVDADKKTYSPYRSSSNMTFSDNLNSIRSRLGLTSTLWDSPSVSNYTSNFSTSTYQPSTSTIDKIESPYLSNFTRRLSALKSESLKPTSYLDRDNKGDNRRSLAHYSSGEECDTTHTTTK